ncbi:BRCA1-associated ATM activator 1 [Trichomycterus rosablanca]|uniref:BRCA1-associated ATM activator 1 n=1 Tax=Trichomycterus rosablanca TaxID=2290929 RepID=UPI002F35E3DD
MDSDCLSLLPSVCEVLTNPNFVLHDDVSLDKLLDWFKEMLSQNDGQHQPCLLHFLHSVTKSQAIDPTVFSFSLKLAGLLAGKEHSYTLLKEKGLLTCIFKPDTWCKLELWKNASVRHGWLQGLFNLLQHQQAVDFFFKNGLIRLVLHLQHDKSLFIASLTCQVVAQILNFTVPPVLSNSVESSVSSEFGLVTTEFVNHLTPSLSSEEPTVVLQALKSLALVLSKCKEPPKRMLWKHVVEPLEVLANGKDDSLTQSIMAVLQAAAGSPILMQQEYRVETIMDILLYARNVKKSVHCARLILLMENCPEVLKTKAIDVIILPLMCATESPMQLHVTEKLLEHKAHLANQLVQKATCVFLLIQSLTGIEELIRMKSLGNTYIQLISASVILLLKICIHHPFALHPTTSFPHLTGCCNVQKCSLDVLASLPGYEESINFFQEAFAVLLQYLQCPDLHATVLKKAHQAALKWLSICLPSPALWKTIKHDLFPLLKKHVCDVRWEVRDSTLEFITQLTATLKGNRHYVEVFHSTDMASVLFTSLSDTEGYVQASAVAALGEAATVCNNLQEKVVTCLLTILSEETESFPRRAAMKVFVLFVKSSNNFTASDKFLSSVLLLGGNDFDWEVKVYTLELADVLFERLLNHCPYMQKIYGISEGTCAMQELKKLKDLGLFDFLLKSLFDCDRPVAQKACAILLKIRTLIKEKSADHHALTLEVYRHSWSKEFLYRCKKQQNTEPNCVDYEDKFFYKQTDTEVNNLCLPKEMDVFKILELLDLEEWQHTLLLSSDHVINSAQSLMEDILFVAKRSEENVVDCY